jgi:hypothetical protein
MSDADNEKTSQWRDSELAFRSTLSALTQALKRYLVVQPKPDALGTAQAALLPSLYALGQDIWNLQVLRADGLPSEERIRYHLRLGEGEVTLDVWAVGTALDRFPARDTLPEGTHWGVRTNGSDWQLIDFTNSAAINNFSLFDEAFPLILDKLFRDNGSDLSTRLHEAVRFAYKTEIASKLEQLITLQGADTVRDRSGGTPEGVLDLLKEEGLIDTVSDVDLGPADLQDLLDYNLKATQMGVVRDAGMMQDIALAEIQRHCQVVKNLKGNLKATFDDTQLDVSSRSGLYYVLAALAVQHGRPDAIPATDLTRPPDVAPTGGRSRPLGKPGWYLSLENSTNFTSGVQQLISALNLGHRLKATNRGAPYPPEA